MWGEEVLKRFVFGVYEDTLTSEIAESPAEQQTLQKKKGPVHINLSLTVD